MKKDTEKILRAKLERLYYYSLIQEKKLLLRQMYKKFKFPFIKS